MFAHPYRAESTVVHLLPKNPKSSSSSGPNPVNLLSAAGSILRGGPGLRDLCDRWKHWRKAVVERPLPRLPISNVEHSPFHGGCSIFRGKIYVLGGCEDQNSCKWGEVFDPKTKTWDSLPMPPDEFNLRCPVMYDSAVVEEKVLAFNGKGTCLFYIPSEGIWKIGKKDRGGIRRNWHVIENVTYCCVTGGKILWCEARESEWGEPEVMEWREVRGLEDLRKSLCGSKLVNYGGSFSDHWEKKRKGPLLRPEIDDFFPGHKISSCGGNMLLFWDVICPESLESEIWCAEISLERCKEKSEVLGKIEWFEAVMNLHPPPRPPHRQHCQCPLMRIL